MQRVIIGAFHSFDGSRLSPIEESFLILNSPTIDVHMPLNLVLTQVRRLAQIHLSQNLLLIQVWKLAQLHMSQNLVLIQVYRVAKLAPLI